MSQEAIEYWNDRATEPLRFQAYSDDECERINRTHYSFTKEEAEAIIKESQK